MTERQTPWWNEWMAHVHDWTDRAGAFFDAQLERLIEFFRRRKKRTA